MSFSNRRVVDQCSIYDHSILSQQLRPRLRISHWASSQWQLWWQLYLQYCYRGPVHNYYVLTASLRTLSV